VSGFRCQEKLAWGMEHRVNAKSFTLCIMLFDFPSLQSHIAHPTAILSGRLMEQIYPGFGGGDALLNKDGIV